MWFYIAQRSSQDVCAFVPRRGLAAGAGSLLFSAAPATAAPSIPPAEAIGAGLRVGGVHLGKECKSWDVLDTSGLEGKVAVVTGANCSIGYQTALALVRGGAEVVLACRDAKKASAAQASMASALEAAGVHRYSLQVAELNLGSLSSVQQFADSWTRSGRPLHMLCLNAGVMAIPEYRTSADGIELTMATNHLGHFALTEALSSVLEASVPARVVTVSSEAHRNPSRPLNVDDLPPSKDKYDDWGAYQQSKLANILFSNELARRFNERGAGVTSNALHPGVIVTELGRQQFLKGSALLSAFQDRTVEQGAATSVYCLTSKNLEGVSGKYFRDCAEVPPSPFALDAEAAQRLWRWSKKVLADHRQASAV